MGGRITSLRKFMDKYENSKTSVKKCQTQLTLKRNIIRGVEYK